ncbi:hypothetical protein H257_13892, partial [Aphanomyces astaci]
GGSFIVQFSIVCTASPKMASRGVSRQIMSSKRARGAQKKSKKLQALEMQQQQQKDASIKLNLLTPTVPTILVNRSLQPIQKAKVVSEQTLEDHEKTDDDEDDDVDDDLILIPRPIEFCARFAPKATWTKDDSNATFCLSIPSFHESTNESGVPQHVAYAILVETPHHTFTVKKRYSEFAAFSNALQVKDVSWELPPKTWFRLTQDAALSDRRARLEAACVDLLQQRPYLALDHSVREFFQLDLFALSVTPSSP